MACGVSWNILTPRGRLLHAVSIDQNPRQAHRIAGSLHPSSASCWGYHTSSMRGFINPKFLYPWISEFLRGEEFHDPFKADVYYTGNLIRTEFMRVRRISSIWNVVLHYTGTSITWRHCLIITNQTMFAWRRGSTWVIARCHPKIDDNWILSSGESSSRTGHSLIPLVSLRMEAIGEHAFPVHHKVLEVEISAEMEWVSKLTEPATTNRWAIWCLCKEN